MFMIILPSENPLQSTETDC